MLTIVSIEVHVLEQENNHMHSTSTWRKGVITSLVVALGFLFTGCTPPEKNDSSATVSYVDAKERTVEIPENPKRVITLSEPALDDAIALDVTPVGTAASRGQSDKVASYLPASAQEIPVVGQLTTPDLEKIRSASPDLIITDGTAINDDVLLGKLNDIAPTIWVGDAGNPIWQDHFQKVANALNKEEEAKKIISDFDAEAQKVKDGLGPNANSQISIVRWGLASGAFLPLSTFPSKIVTSLGMTRPEGQNIEGAGHSEQVSLENIDLLDGDWMFFCTLGGAAGAETVRDGGGDTGVKASDQTLEKAKELAPTFANLSVIQRGKVITVDGTAWGSAGGALAAKTVLADIKTHLTTLEN